MEQELKADWYPVVKTKPAPSCPRFVNLDLFESGQVQEAWAIEGNIGPEAMGWLDGHFAGWFPKLTIERAIYTIAAWNTRTGDQS